MVVLSKGQTSLELALMQALVSKTFDPLKQPLLQVHLLELTVGMQAQSYIKRYSGIAKEFNLALARAAAG